MLRLIITAIAVLAPAAAQAQSVGRLTAPVATTGRQQSLGALGSTAALSANPAAFGTNPLATLGSKGATVGTGTAVGTSASSGASAGDPGAPINVPTGSGIIEGGNSLSIAATLEDVLGALQDDAQSLSDAAAAAGYDADAQALSDLNQDANSLAQELQNSVVVPLQTLVPVPTVLGHAQRLGTWFDTLDYDVSNMDSVPDVIESDLQAAADLRDQLDAELLNSERDRPTRNP